MTNVSYIMRDY